MKSFLITAFGLALASTSINRIAHSEELPPICPPTNTVANLNSVVDGDNNMCRLTPEKYQVQIYEMGLCTQAPIVSSVFSKDSCIPTLINSSPISADMSGRKSVNLKSQTRLPRPASGKYSHAYMILAPVFKLQFSYTLGGVTYYSKSTSTSYSTPNSNATTDGPSLSFDETIDTFDFTEGFSPTVENFLVKGGTMTALLTDNDFNAATSTGSVTRLVGSYMPDSEVIISEDTVGLEVEFTVTDMGGYAATGDSDNDSIGAFESGPFSMSFTTF